MTFKRNSTYICLSLTLLLTTGALAFDQVEKPQHLAEKFANEAARIVKDYTSFMDDETSSPTSQAPKYSAEEYGSFAAALNKFKQMMDFSKQEAMAAAQSIKEIGNIFTDEVIFDFLKIIEKKKKLEKLSTLAIDFSDF